MQRRKGPPLVSKRAASTEPVVKLPRPGPGQTSHDVLQAFLGQRKGKSRKPKRVPRPNPDAVAPRGPDVIVGFVVPVHTRNESNGEQGSWAAKAKKRKTVRGPTRMCAQAAMMPPPSPPLVVVITRHSAGKLDPDGLASALKSVQDGIADWLGVNDAAEDLVRYERAQKPCKPGMSWITVEVRRAPSVNEQPVQHHEGIGLHFADKERQ